MRRLFGTDGIRAKAGAFPLDNATMWALGKTLALRLPREHQQPTVMLGMDTRESGSDIARALTAGLIAGGGITEFIGVVPTPGVAFLCRDPHVEAGISISASHNPFEDNGVKVFGNDGMKISDELEKKIEDELLELREHAPAEINAELREDESLLRRYIEFLATGVDGNALRGKKVVLDTGNGAAYRIAGEVFRAAGADPIVINDAPDGRNINAGCGALHPEKLAERVVAEGADLGIAFDGDADRAIFVDDQGRVRDGDEVLFIWGTHEKERGRLTNDTIVATVMSNFGFERELQNRGIRLLRANVGDKYVLETMIKEKAVLGGEQSGHVIDLQVHTTGDGLHTALSLAAILAEKKQRFSELATFEPMPQILKNERVASKPPLDSLPRYSDARNDAERELEGRGRILVRYSGTENLVRVMVEGDDQAKITRIADRLCSVLREEIAG